MYEDPKSTKYVFDRNKSCYIESKCFLIHETSVKQGIKVHMK